MRFRSISDTALLKEEIQGLVREIVIKRDGGCILRNEQGIGGCSGFRKDGKLVLQADHLITRGNSATYDDTRLIVCLCKGHHGGFKQWNKEQYDDRVRTLLSPARVKLWDRAQQDSWKPTHRISSDWKIAIAALKQELATYG